MLFNFEITMLKMIYSSPKYVQMSHVSYKIINDQNHQIINAFANFVKKLFSVRFPSRCSSKLNPDIKDLIWRLICVDVKSRMHVSMIHLHQWTRRLEERPRKSLIMSRTNVVDNPASPGRQEYIKQFQFTPFFCHIFMISQPI